MTDAMKKALKSYLVTMPIQAPMATVPGWVIKEKDAALIPVAVVMFGQGQTQSDRAEAYAKLFAVAPQMFRLLKRCTQELEEFGIDSDLVDDIEDLQHNVLDL